MAKKSEGEIILKTKVSFEDYKEFNNFYSFDVMKQKSIIALAIIVLILTLTLEALLENYGAMIYSVFVALFASVIINYYYKKIIKDYYKSAEYKLNIPGEVKLFEDYLECCDEFSSLKVFYNNIYATYESKASIYIFINNKEVVIINKERNNKVPLAKAITKLMSVTDYKSY